MARGFDAATSQNLALKGYTVWELQQKTCKMLKALSLSDELIAKLLTEKRPPIPAKTLHIVLFGSAYTCCICRDKSHPIIVHHLIEWAVSRNHNISNLSVLCLNCHAKAHSKSTISLNLTPERIRKAKATWEKTVRKNELRDLFTKSSWNLLSGIWDYFNHSRIIDTICQLGIDPTKVAGYNVLYANGSINSDGSYVWPAPPAPCMEKLQFMYQGGIPGMANTLQNFYANLVRKILESTKFVDLTYNFRKSAALNLLHINDFICVTGGHRFKSFHNIQTLGPGQMREGYRQANGLRIAFKFDAWETTSSSSHNVHLRNMWRCTTISIVRSISLGKKMHTVDCTCLAIGTGFTEYRGKIPSIAFEKMSDN